MHHRQLFSLQLISLAVFLLLGAGQTTALALTNGPVTWNGYSVFYSTIDFSSIESNYLAQNGSVPDATNKAPTTTSANPPFVAGNYNIPGLGSNPGMMLPWWNPNSSASAQAAAFAWYNHSGSLNDGTKYPNSGGSETPRFIYGYTDAFDSVRWVSYSSDGTLIVNDTNIEDTGISFALAGVSN